MSESLADESSQILEVAMLCYHDQHNAWVHLQAVQHVRDELVRLGLEEHQLLHELEVCACVRWVCLCACRGREGEGIYINITKLINAFKPKGAYWITLLLALATLWALYITHSRLERGKLTHPCILDKG